MPACAMFCARSAVVLLVACVLASQHRLSNCHPATAGSRPQGDPIRDLLREVAIPLPDVRIPLGHPRRDDALLLSRIACGNFTLGPIASLHSPARHSVDLAIAGLGLNCSGSWSIEGNFSVQEADEASRGTVAPECYTLQASSSRFSLTMMTRR